MAEFLWIQVLWLLLPLCCRSSILNFFELDYIRDEYTRIVQCSTNDSTTVNDYGKLIIMNCNGGVANTSNLLNCTGLSRIAAIAFIDCQLPTSNIYILVKEFNLQAIAYLIINFPLIPKEIIVKDLTFVELLGLSLRNSTKYILQNLPRLRQIDMLFPEIIPAHLLSNLTLLNKVVLINGKIKSIPEVTFRGLERLRTLNLRNNMLKALPNGIFEGLILLRQLELSYNRLEFLPVNIFNNLINLEQIILSNNLLTQLHPMLFINQQNLKILDISNNLNIVAISEELLRNCFNLREFYANNCSLKFLPEKLFAFATSLSSLYLSGNRISSLSTKIFEENIPLSTLDLSGNQLQFLPEGIFRRNYKLSALFLDNNLFKRIPIEPLLSAKNLATIYLSDNLIVSADEPRLEFLQRLKILMLDNNNISSFNTTTPFGKLSHLSYLGLSFNDFDSFPNLDWKVYNITNLSMNNNEISHLRIASLPPGNATIDLRFNKIESVSLATKSSTLGLEIVQIYLGSNPFICDCNLSNFLQILHDGNPVSRHSILLSDADNLKCNNPPNWKSRHLMQISPLYLLCPVSNLCPQQCQCYQLSNLMVLVNCTSLGLTAFPDILPENTSIVHLENNSISEFTIINTEYWKTVTHLYLDNNHLVTPNVWPMLNVKYLSLRNNRLVQLPKNLMEYITDTPKFLLDIRGNSWMCICTYLPFKLWLVEYSEKLVFPEEISCNRTILENGTLASYPILKIPDDAFCPPNITSMNVRVIIAVFTSCSVCIAAAIFLVIHYGNRQTFMAFLYVHFPSIFCCDLSDIERDKPYDAFISYCSSDREEVITVLKELEEKPPNFKFCIHERDWLPGYPIISQIETSVQNSKKTVIILSKQFLDSFWCETEFQMAYMQSLEDKIDRLIIIVKGELPEKDTIPLDVQNLLTTTTYLVWGERWFWEKLKYALPHFNRAERKIEQEVIVDGMIQKFRDAKLI